MYVQFFDYIGSGSYKKRRFSSPSVDLTNSIKEQKLSAHLFD